MITYQPKQMLVTGGAGFIGSHFIRHVLRQKNGIKVINLDALTYAGSLDSLNNLPRSEDYTFIEGDICNTELIHQIFKTYNIGTVVHFAAESHVDRSILAPGAFVLTNVVGTFNLIETARLQWLVDRKLNADQCRFYQISTDEVFGSLAPNEAPFTEHSPYKPNSPYSASKAAADHLVRSHHHTYGLPITISTCSNNYGSRQHSEKFIPTVIRSCLAWEPIPIYGKGDQIRDWLYVEDHCKAIYLILTQGQIGETYNIGGNNEQINLDVVKRICKIFDELLPQKNAYETLINFISDRPGHDLRYAINCSKIKQELGWKPTTNFAEGLYETVIAYLAID